MKKILFTALLSFCSLSAFPAQIYHLTLDQSVELAKEKSYNMQNLEYTLKIARENFRVAMAAQRTNISLDATLPNFASSVTQGITQIKDDGGRVVDEIPYYLSKKSLSMSGGLTIRQPLPTDGSVSLETNYSIASDYDRNRRDGSFNTLLRFTQPLDALYGYNSTRAAIKNARLSLEAAEKSYKRSELDLIYRISQSYYQLLSLQKRMELAQLDLDRQREASQIAADKFGAGLIREVENMQMEVELATAESSYDEAMFNMYEQTNSFKELIGLSAQDSVVLVSEITYDIVNVDPDRAVELALKNRLEIRETEINVEQQRLNLKQQKANGLPKTTIETTVGKTGVSNNKSFGYGYGNAMDDMFQDLSDRPWNYSVRLRLSVPIIDWGANRARVRISEARLEQSLLLQEQTEREIESQVRSLISSINSNLRRLQILEKSVEIAQKSFDITLERFSAQDITSQDFALERARLNNANLTYLSAYINYQLSLIDLTRQTFYDFRENRPIE